MEAETGVRWPRAKERQRPSGRSWKRQGMDRALESSPCICLQNPQGHFQGWTRDQLKGGKLPFPRSSALGPLDPRPLLQPCSQPGLHPPTLVLPIPSPPHTPHPCSQAQILR